MRTSGASTSWSRRQVLAGSGLVALGGALAACGATPQVVEKIVESTVVVEKVVVATPAPGEELAITYWDWWSPSQSAVMAKLFEVMPVEWANRHPEIKLAIQYVPFADYFTKFMAAHAAGDPPDTMHCSVNWARDCFDKGAILDLKDYLDASPDVAADRMLPGSLFQATKGSSQYGVPGEGPDSDLFFYNVDLLEQAGVDTTREVIAKWTWDDFSAAAQKVTKDDLSTTGFTCYTPDDHTLAAWANTHCEGCGFYKPEMKGVAFNDSDAAIHGFEWFLSMLYDNPVSQPISPERQDWNMFKEGVVAITRSGPWSFSELQTDVPDLKWGVTVYPAYPDGGRPGTVTWNNLLVMPSAAKHKDAGWKLLEFLCGLDWMVQRLKIGAWMSPRKDFYDTQEYKDALAALEWLDMVPYATGIGTTVSFIQENSIANALQPLMEGAILRQMDLGQAINEAVKACNDLLAEAGYA